MIRSPAPNLHPAMAVGGREQSLACRYRLRRVERKHAPESYPNVSLAKARLLRVSEWQVQTLTKVALDGSLVGENGPSALGRQGDRCESGEPNCRRDYLRTRFCHAANCVATSPVRSSYASVTSIKCNPQSLRITDPTATSPGTSSMRGSAGSALTRTDR